MHAYYVCRIYMHSCMHTYCVYIVCGGRAPRGRPRLVSRRRGAERAGLQRDPDRRATGRGPEGARELWSLARGPVWPEHGRCRSKSERAELNTERPHVSGLRRSLHANYACMICMHDMHAYYECICFRNLLVFVQ